MPTPVSALIHAATMVTAGVYLISRCSPIFEYSMFSLKVITIIGASTSFFAGTVGLVQNYFKKIRKLSTSTPAAIHRTTNVHINNFQPKLAK